MMTTIQTVDLNRVWLIREVSLHRTDGSDTLKFLPAGTCLWLSDAEAPWHGVFVYGAGCYDFVSLENLSLVP